MGLRSDTREELRRETVTKIFGQPKDADLTTLEKELIAIAASIPTASEEEIMVMPESSWKKQDLSNASKYNDSIILEYTRNINASKTNDDNGVPMDQRTTDACHDAPQLGTMTSSDVAHIPPPYDP